MESAFKKNITEQVERLLSQLQDLDTFKDDPDISKEEFEYKISPFNFWSI